MFHVSDLKATSKVPHALEVFTFTEFIKGHGGQTPHETYKIVETYFQIVKLYCCNNIHRNVVYRGARESLAPHESCMAYLNCLQLFTVLIKCENKKAVVPVA